MTEKMADQGFDTKMRIVEALDALVASQDYDQVTVSAICERASVSRSTFYHHFADKNAIMHWHSALIYNLGIDQIGRTRTWYQGHYITSALLDRRKNLYYRAGRIADYGNVRSHFVRRRVEVLKETIEQHKQVKLDELLEFQVQLVAEMEAAMADRRYRDEASYSSETYARLIAQSIPEPIFSILNTPNKPAEGGLELKLMLELAGIAQ